jgi:putative aldouronate transport system permease protein
MIAPTLLFFIIFAYIPMVGVYYAFTHFNFSGGLFGSPFCGIDNFKFLFTGGWHAVILKLSANTVLYNLAFILLGSICQMMIAIILSELAAKWFKKLTHSLMFLPYFISYVIVGVFIYNIFNYDYGLFNNILKGLGLEAADFYGMPGAWKYIITASYLWKNIGYGSIIYLAAIVGIDGSIYEAAEIDGASIVQKIRLITLPLLKPTFVLLLLFSLGGIMRGQFELFYQVIGRNGLLYNATDIIDTYVYRALAVNFDIGLGTAAGLYQSLFGFILVMTVNYIVRKIDSDYALF